MRRDAGAGEPPGGAQPAANYPHYMRHRLRAAALLTALVAALLAGCGGTEEPQDTPVTTLQPTGSPEPSSSSPAGPTEQPSDAPTGLPENVQAAIDDLAERLSVPAADIQAGPLQAVTWSDGSLGCPTAGTSYPQVLTDGYLLVLTANGEDHEYHAGQDGDLFYCENPTSPAAEDTQSS